jgi:hypothetical protein
MAYILFRRIFLQNLQIKNKRLGLEDKFLIGVSYVELHKLEQFLQNEMRMLIGSHGILQNHNEIGSLLEFLFRLLYRFCRFSLFE